jgi:long-chain acyl-CoA synthetase
MRFQNALVEAALDRGDRVGLLLKNCVDWVCFDIAALRLGLVVVPLYAHDSGANLAYIISDSQARLLLLDGPARWEAITAAGLDLSAVDRVWFKDAGDLPAGAASRPALAALGSVLMARPADLTRPSLKPDDLATIIYTSGTTGPPKGVMLDHASILWNAEAASEFVPPEREDVFLSFLPLAHAFERTMGYYLPMMAGSTVAYARSPVKLREDLNTLRPTVLLSVPRLFEQICAAIRARTEKSPIRRRLVGVTSRIGWQLFEAERGRAVGPGPLGRLAWPALRRLVANPILQAFGGRLRVAVSGGAPLGMEVARFLIGMGLPLVEGYGLTEASPVVTGTTLRDNLPGSVGRPLRGLDAKLTEEGELVIRSPGVMRGYWRAPEKTREAFTPDGWLKTGDLAEIRDGRIFIIGRLVEQMKLSTGEKVNPVSLEDAIRKDPLVDQICVFGAGRMFVSAILVLNAEHWRELAAEWGSDPSSPNQPSVRNRILARLKPLLSQAPKFAQVLAVHLELEPWTVENGLLTPTLKVKRRAVADKYRDVIADIYRHS